MIAVTGAAGFIGSCLVGRLNAAGYNDILVVDDFSRADKKRNLEGKTIHSQVHRSNFLRWLERHHADVDAVFHLGARTDTTEMNPAVFDLLNLEYSKGLFMLCAGFDIPFYYASSAATYGLGELGYSDDHSLIPRLRPLNPYGQSKQDFDVWLLETGLSPAPSEGGGDARAYDLNKKPGATGAAASPPPPEGAGGRLAGFKFFNVYGPNEYHKGRMASVVYHTARQIRETGAMKLFRSHRPDFRDGEQSRDFIYVKDVVDVLLHFLENKPPNAIYNLGTGRSRTFLDLATATFRSLGLEPNISFIDTPEDIRDKYQYFTEADITKLRTLGGYQKPFYGLEEGVEDYVKNYLRPLFHTP
jgi:ADP-L-glycero-D-manno-heptose 6-epimerase